MGLALAVILQYPLSAANDLKVVETLSKRKKEDILPECPAAVTVSLIGSKWKLLIMRPIIQAMENWGNNDICF